ISPELADSAAALDRVYVRGTGGNTVPLGAFCRWQESRAAISLAHEGQFPSVTLSFNLAPGESLGAATRAVERAVAELGAPVGLHGAFQGAAAAFSESLATEPLLILAA